MSQGGILDKRLVSQIREYLEQSVGSLVTVSSTIDYLTSRFPEYNRKNKAIFAKKVNAAYVIAKKSLESKSQPTSPLPEEESAGEISPMSQISDSDSKQKRRRQKPSSSVLSLNDNLHATYTTVDKEKDDELKSKKAKMRTKPGSVRKSDSYPIASCRFVLHLHSDLAGIDGVLQDIRELIEYPLTHPEIYTHIGIDPPRGILLHGPPGCGKTLLARAIGGELGIPLISISAPEIVSGMSGESEEKLRKLFDDAIAIAPSIIFIDEIDAITGKRDNSNRGMERRIVAQLQTCMDSLNSKEMREKPVMIIGATNRPDALDSALRRAGRFDREICLGIPDEAARCAILKLLTRQMQISGSIDYEVLAAKTPGYVGADLSAKEAAIIAVNRIFHALFSKPANGITNDTTTPIDTVNDTITTTPTTTPTVTTSGTTTTSEASNDVATDTTTMDVLPTTTPHSTARDIASRMEVAEQIKEQATIPATQLSQLAVEMADFEQALKKVQPSSKREGFVTVPNTTWDDIGALTHVREKLRISVVEPIRNPQLFRAMGLAMPAGVLLYGPPGCGKTLLAKAVSNESRANFISIKGPELLNKYVGESERGVRQVFERARASSPCVIFFDEIDALCPKRGMDGGSSGVSERMVNMLLTEMDGLEDRKQVFVIAATNRPDIIDPAMLRPGRLDTLLLVPLPSEDDRLDILRTITKHTPLAADVDLERIARDKRCERFSGADLSNLVREATLTAIRPSLLSGQPAPSVVTQADFESALQVVKPSVSKEDLEKYCREPNIRDAM
ncbi:hypothetical protein BLSTO_01747 [Blastocystis sp. subtype 1]